MFSSRFKLADIRRIRILTQEMLSPNEMQEVVGVDPTNRYSYSYFLSFYKGSRFNVTKEGKYSRVLFELFLQKFGFIPTIQAALQLGMSHDSFLEVIEKLNLDSNLIDSNLIDISSLKRIKALAATGTIFPDHSTFCEELHNNLRRKFSITVEPIYCEVSLLIDKQSPNFSYYRCAVTHTPVSLQYAIPINTKKSIQLEPDIISVATYKKAIKSNMEHFFNDLLLIDKKSFINDLEYINIHV